MFGIVINLLQLGFIRIDMKASEALRKGMGMVKGQAKEVYYNPITDCACALGCIGLGMGKGKHELLDHCFLDGKAYTKYKDYYKSTIDFDNDFSGMSLSQIAQRLEDIGE